eukprot:TRINITY_DN3696_c0_g2_i3.p1 TRINITY_DN3696_c0_g2~~TRINITY_DN3696_c0_g2_i3.p1  ORF type:complete len:156 (-),score=47.48 TRINITY_DN3696_c0_g2_i3:69-536(-)
MSAEAALKQQGIDLPEPATPAFSYIPTVITGNQIWVSGQVPFKGKDLLHCGKVGGSVSLEQAQEAAKQCVINGLAHVKKAIGSLDEVSRVIKVTVFVASAPGFTDQPKVANGASDFLISVFGENGRHTRSAVGVFELPLGVSVEVEMVLELKAKL